MIKGSALTKVNILDCFLDTESIRRFSSCLNKTRLSHICLDYNRIGEKGCGELCDGLIDNGTIISLSLNYCELTENCGVLIGKIAEKTAIRLIFI
jgi:hypothetical protein